MVFLIFVIPNPEVEAVAVVDDVALLLLATLAAFGITFTAAGGVDEVAPWILDKLEDYVDSIDQELDVILSQMRYGVNKAGDLIGNAFALSFNARFAQWLKDEYSLVDNSSVSVPSSSFIPVTGSSYSSIVSAGYVDHYFLEEGVISSVYFGASSSGSVSLVWLNDISTGEIGGVIVASLVQSSFYVARSSPFSDSFTLSISQPDPFGYYYFVELFPNDYNFNYIDSSVSSFVFPSYEAAVHSIPSLLGSSPFFTVNTGSIDIPQVGDYSDDEGILIDGIGSWGDTLQDILDKIAGLTLPDSAWPTVTWGAELADQLVDALVSAGELTTENSPGYFNGLPGSIPDINFGGLWHYVTDWVGSMSAGLSLIGGIMFSLPFVAAFYAVVVILLVLSLWRLLRSA